MLDIIFLSYDESNAESNWQTLRSRFPHAQRVHGVKGVKQAHQQAALLSRSDFFFIVDGDNQIHDNFDFRLDFEPQKDTLYVWRCLNPVNDLCYGFGGVKLYNKFLLLELNKPTSIDVATTVALKYKPIFKTASTTAYNSTPFEAWRGAFRESVKLTNNILKNPHDEPSRERLNLWCLKGTDRANGAWSILGALQGRDYVYKYFPDDERLTRINDFDWLKKHFHTLNCHEEILLPPNPV